MGCSPKVWVNLGVGEKVALPIRHDDVSGATDFKKQSLMPLGHLGSKKMALREVLLTRSRV